MIGPAADSIALPLRTLQCHNPGLMALDNAQIASASVGMLLPLIGALAVWPLFAFGKRVVGARAAALAAALFPIMPLFAMWPAQWDQIYPLLLLSGLYFMYTGLASRPSTALRSAHAMSQPQAGWRTGGMRRSFRGGEFYSRVCRCRSRHFSAWATLC